MSLRYAIIGTGAIGGYYGGRLQQAGCDVHFLLRSDYEQVKQQGLHINSVDGDFVLTKVDAYRDPADMPPVDVVVVALKTTHNDRLAELMPALNPGGTVLSLQNGWAVERAIAQHLKEQKGISPDILGGLCFIYANKPAPGYVQHLGYGKLLLGSYDEGDWRCALTERGRAIATDFEQTTIAVETTEDLPMARWRKLVWNVPYNSLSVILDATTGEMMADVGVRSLIKTLMTEVVTLANAWGEQTSPNSNRSISNDFIEEMLNITAEVSAYRTSMKVDYDEKRALEIKTILENPLRTAEAIGVSVPAIKMLYHQLSFLNRQTLLLLDNQSG